MPTHNSQDALRVYYSPSTLAIAIAAAILGAVGGYFIGQGMSLLDARERVNKELRKNKKAVEKSKKSKEKQKEIPDSEEEETEEEGEETEEEEEGDVKDEFEGHEGEECKLVLVVRTDLGMTKGKIAAQCSHATLACYKALSSISPASPVLRRWERQGQMKVAVQVKSEEELEVLQAQAVSLGIVVRVVRDAGRTQIAAGSATVLGVGPAPKAVVDQVTGGLKLL